jgi:serine/threonine protein kinase/Leucine-rich repeat (LRR) protein
MNEETIFATALEKPPSERAAYLADACGNDEALRQRMEGLLAASEKVGNFMANPAVAPAVDPAATEVLSAPADGAVKAADPDEEALAFLTPSARPDSLGRLGHYEVLQVLGRGGFGIVFRAFDEMLQRVVALKVMAPQLAATSPARKRFLREARSSAQVRHENVVQVYEVAEQPLPYLAMEFIPGETLQQWLDRVGPLDVPEVLRIGRQIAEGLAAAHATELIHRDIKPGNVLLEGGQHKVKITDFGLARAADDASISQSGIIAGTPMYMAPEQAQGQTFDQRADLFSLGSVLYQMVAGRPPFRASTSVAVLKRVADDTPRPIREIIPETPQWLCDIIAKLHAKNPDDRYQSAREVADVLADCEAQLKANSRLKDYSRIPRSQPQRSGPRSRFRIGRRATAAAVLLLLLGGLGFTEATGVTDFRGTVIRLFSPEGTLVVEVDDPGVSIKIDESDIVITGAGAKEIRLKPGRYTVEASKDGKLVTRKLVTVTTNGKEVVRISQEPVTVPNTAREQEDPDRRAAEYVLSIGGWVKVNDQDQEIHANADLPRDQFRLTVVDLHDNTQVTDAGLAVFKDCRHVTLLGLWYARRITDAGLANFAGCQNITQLHLQGTKVTDRGLAQFKGSTIITALYLHGLQITDTGLAHFKDCKALTHLFLGGTQVSDVGLAHFKDCKNLTYLHLQNTRVSDAGLVHFKDCKALTHLWLGGTQVSDVGLANFQSMPLMELQIEDTGITDLTPLQGMALEDIRLTPKNITRGLDILRDMNSLKTIGIKWDQSWPGAEFWERYDKGEFKVRASQEKGAGAQTTDADRHAAEYVLSLGGYVKVEDDGRDIKAVAQLPNRAFRLSFVSLWGRKNVTDVGVAVFKDCKALDVLDLTSTSITDAGVAQLKDCKNLTYLNLGFTKVTDAGLAQLKDCESLTYLNLDHTPITDAGMAYLKDCKKLTELCVHNTKVTDAGLAHLKDCKNLTKLVLEGTPVTDVGLEYLIGLKDLTELQLGAKTNVTAHGVQRLAKALPNCRIVWNGGVF